MTDASDEKILDIVRKFGFVRPVDLEEQGYPRSRLYRLVREGKVLWEEIETWPGYEAETKGKARK